MYDNSYVKPKKYNVSHVVTYIVLGVIILTLAVFLIFSLFNKSNIGVTEDTVSSIPADTNNTDKSTEPLIIITECPEQVNSDDDKFTVSGYIVSDLGSCELKINGKDVCKTSGAGKQSQWDESFYVSDTGEKNLEFIVTDENGNSSSEKHSVKIIDTQKIKEDEKSQEVKEVPVTPGCAFIKRKPGGLNIREYAGTDYNVVDMIGDNDYTSRMVFTGHYVTDDNNFTWYEIISPNGQHGYVRSDLVRAVQ